MIPDLTNVNSTEIWSLITIILGLVSGTSIWKNVTQYLALARKDLHYVRDFVDMADNFAQDPNDANWTNLWNKFATSIRARVPKTPTP